MPAALDADLFARVRELTLAAGAFFRCRFFIASVVSFCFARCSSRQPQRWLLPKRAELWRFARRIEAWLGSTRSEALPRRLAAVSILARSACIQVVGGHGTGFVVSAYGLVVTAHHVVANAFDRLAVMPGSTEPRAAIPVYVDEEHDIAILQVQGRFADVVDVPTREVALVAR